MNAFLTFRRAVPNAHRRVGCGGPRKGDRPPSIVANPALGGQILRHQVDVIGCHHIPSDEASHAPAGRHRSEHTRGPAWTAPDKWQNKRTTIRGFVVAACIPPPRPATEHIRPSGLLREVADGSRSSKRTHSERGAGLTTRDIPFPINPWPLPLDRMHSVRQSAPSSRVIL